MNTTTAPATQAPRTEKSPAVSRGLIFLLATACGLMAANLYYSQPLAGPIGAALGMPAASTGLIVTLTQVGYVIGLLFVVPLGDLMENRRLVLGLLGMATLALLGAARSTHPMPFLVAALFIGIGSVAVQVLVPYAGHLAPEATRGRVVGNVLGGLLLGIMLARPVASLVAQYTSWHVVFYGSAGVMLLLMGVLHRALPPRMPPARLRYGQLLASMGRLVLQFPLLRRRAFYQACLFGAFSLFWTTTPLLLAGPAFRMSQAGIALFALAGAAGAVAAPIAGRVADRGWIRPATGLSMLAVALAFLLGQVGAAGSHLALAMLVLSAVLLDFGVQANGTLGVRAIFTLGAEYRARLNGLYMATFFVGGAAGSALGAWAFAHGGWLLSSCVGIALPIIGLLYYCTESR